MKKDRWRQRRLLQRPGGPSGNESNSDGSSIAFSSSRSSSPAATKKTGQNAGVVATNLPLALVFLLAFSHPMSHEDCTADAFAVFRPGPILSNSPSTTKQEQPIASPTSLFLFSLRDNDNDNNGSEENSTDNKSSESKDEGATATIEKSKSTGEIMTEEYSEDFTAWMEGLKLGTPLGKMAAPTLVPDEDEPTSTPPEPSSASIQQQPRDDDKKNDDSSSENAAPGASNIQSPARGISSVSLRDSSSIETTRRRKINPLSNLIQFEAMVELAKIAGSNKEESGVGGGDSDSDDKSSGADVFAVVDRLVKTFQKQEEDKQKGRDKLLQLAQLEEKLILEQDDLVKDKSTNDKETGGGDGYIVAKAEDLSADTTVKDLMELERYVGGLPFPKVANMWESFSGKVDSPSITGGDVDAGDSGTYEAKKKEETEKDTIPSANSTPGPASLSPLFRDKNTNADNPIASSTKASSTNLAQAAESILKDTTSKMEYLVAEASSSILEPSVDGSSNTTVSSTSALQDLVGRASSVFNDNSIAAAPRTTGSASTTGTIVEAISNDIVTAAQKIAKESGVDINVQFAADRAREATEFAVGVAATANVVLDSGYAYGSRSGVTGSNGRDDDLNYMAASAATQTAGSVFSPGGVAATNGQGKALVSASSTGGTVLPTHQPPLFGDFASAQRIEPYEYDNVVYQGAEMGVLAGAIYEDPEIRCHKQGHSIVANGTTANVAWMVTDSVMDGEHCASAFRHHEDESRKSESTTPSPSGPVMVRTITIRGFDASDESVDRDALLNEICFATPEAMDEATADKVVFHTGLLNIARQIYAETKKYIGWTAPNHKIVLNGHSVGGSLSVLILLLITSERGVDYVRDRILRVYSHGSPPVATLVNNSTTKLADDQKFSGTQRCPVLEAFGLPSSTIYGFIQPYDPVVRLFSNHDVLYPLVDDLGADGVTLYSTGPKIRSLRPITRAIFQAWNGWPQFRDNWKGTCDTQYQSVGIQHLLLPEPLRYLNDRFISVNVGVPPVDAIVRISPYELLPALDLTFPLDTFQVSLVPQAVRSFLHHFYPAYDSAIFDYANKVKNEQNADVPKKSGAFKPYQTTQS